MSIFKRLSEVRFGNMLVGKVARDIFSPLSLFRNGLNIRVGGKLIGWLVHRLAVPVAWHAMP